MIAEMYDKKPVYVFLDNLPAHHNKEVKETAAELGLELVFNASYYSEVNPIERLWNYSKREFQKKVIKHEDWKDLD